MRLRRLVTQSSALLQLMPHGRCIPLGDALSEQDVIFKSNWRSIIATGDIDAQTDVVEVQHQRTQHPKVQPTAMQTETATDVGAVPLLRSGYKQLHELDAFLEHCTPLIEAQLMRNLSSRAFDGHEVAWEEQHDNVECLHVLKHSGALARLSPDAATCAAWNAPGTIVAAAYGALDRNDWPRCNSMVCVWSLFRRQLDPQKADTAIELQNCLTCLAFHPTEPSLLAGGAYNGDVLLWRIGSSKEHIDPLVGKSVLTNYTHHEPVLALAWTRDPRRSLSAAADAAFVLASVGADGKLLCWGGASAMHEPRQGFLLSAAFFSMQDKDGDGQITHEVAHLPPTALLYLDQRSL